ncbi:MAG: hypothetical protein ACRERV_08250 [Methylococcales bacterium]
MAWRRYTITSLRHQFSPRRKNEKNLQFALIFTFIAAFVIVAFASTTNVQARPALQATATATVSAMPAAMTQVDEPAAKYYTEKGGKLPFTLHLPSTLIPKETPCPSSKAPRR